VSVLSAGTIHTRGIAKRYKAGRTRASLPDLRETLMVPFARLAGKGGAKEEGWFWALHDISFDVKPGEVLGIVGSNGAGKSTLLKILSRIVDPTAGRIEMAGRLGCLLEVGTGFHRELTGRENVFLNGAILGMSRRETQAKFDAIVDFSGIEPFIDTPVKHYSSGMYLRLGFAVAAHIDPEILIIDEVLAVGDAAFQAKCIGKVGELVSEGRTVLIVSHQLPVIQKLCTRAILIREGSVAADGPTSEVVSGYLKMLEHHSETDLSERTLRAGNGIRRLVRLEAGGLNGVALMAGEPAEFVFHVSGTPGSSTCAFEFFDDLAQGVTSFNSANPARDEDLTDGDRGIFRCVVPTLPLRPGRYRIDVAITARSGALEDHVEGAAYVDVLEGILAGRPVIADVGYGNVAVVHRWSHG
jgi:lipopolysaccharide transport system ATP-binding protein